MYRNLEVEFSWIIFLALFSKNLKNIGRFLILNWFSILNYGKLTNSFWESSSLVFSLYSLELWCDYNYEFTVKKLINFAIKHLQTNFINYIS